MSGVKESVMARILVIEDNYQLLRLCTRLLQNEDYEVYPAAAYHAALDMFRLYGQFALCISDIEVGAYDSTIMLKDLHRLGEHYHTPILLMSAHIERYQLLCDALNMPYLEKPFLNQAFLECVRELVIKDATTDSGI